MIATLSVAEVNTMTVPELAEWYATNRDELERFASAHRRAAGRLREAIRDQGPLQTSAGKLSLGADLMAWAPETATEFPTLGKHIVTAKVGTIEEAEQILELVLELVPTADVSHDLKVEARLATAFQKVATPEQAVRLAELRTPNGKLEVK